MELHKTFGNEREALGSIAFKEDVDEAFKKFGITGSRSSDDVRASEALGDGEVSTIIATTTQDIHKVAHKFISE